MTGASSSDAQESTHLKNTSTNKRTRIQYTRNTFLKSQAATSVPYRQKIMYFSTAHYFNSSLILQADKRIDTPNTESQLPKFRNLRSFPDFLGQEMPKSLNGFFLVALSVLFVLYTRISTSAIFGTLIREGSGRSIRVRRWPLNVESAVSTQFRTIRSTISDVSYHIANRPSAGPSFPFNLNEETNTRIPFRSNNQKGQILAHTAWPEGGGDGKIPLLILIHEFFGLNPSIIDKADALAKELNCVVIAPDTFRGVSTTFIPRAIWLALSTPEERVNDDIDAVVDWASEHERIDSSRIALMGFCYGGGKAIRYTTQRLPTAATVVCYGSPVIDPDILKNLKAPVCGIYGSLDPQFPPSILSNFRSGLNEAGIEHRLEVYEGVGHAFWANMDQITCGQKPQIDAW
eukprot:CAMPEP_0185280660 /NCGR_PEP_ID=MMETSP1359-20130426/66267_1 /TAXON_ID=552665 /ORGANISM="Bigelowiella longifila, Strain CCMP242" /LENGTH=402 /DNA_ID=CAMNT_0027875967 /DNA_START=1275 /DNA_END=2481 /DNA_ORIENTATION=-